MRYSARPLPGEVYRFRSVDALIGDQKELFRQTIYLATPNQLNDVAEDTVNVVWRGDEILWPNLIGYYYRSLAASQITGFVFLPGYHFVVPRYQPLESSHLSRPVEELAAHYRDEYQSQVIEVLTELDQRSEPVVGHDLQNMLDKLSPPEVRANHPLADSHRLRGFAQRFLQGMGKLLLSEWGVACFTRNFTNPYLWSTYAENNTGVCLVYERQRLENLQPPKYCDEVELEDVNYETTKPDIEFFANVPSLSESEYTRLFTDELGAPSPLCPFLPIDKPKVQAARAAQREFSRRTLLTKHRAWGPEEEVRMFCRFDWGGVLGSGPEKHTLQYPMGALKEIIFGARTSDDDKRAILEVVLSKHYHAPILHDFRFSEAAQRHDGSFDRRWYGPYVTWQHDFKYPDTRG